MLAENWDIVDLCTTKWSGFMIYKPRRYVEQVHNVSVCGIWAILTYWVYWFYDRLDGEAKDIWGLEYL